MLDFLTCVCIDGLNDIILVYSLFYCQCDNLFFAVVSLSTQVVPSVLNINLTM